MPFGLRAIRQDLLPAQRAYPPRRAIERALVAALVPAGIGKLDYGNLRVEGLVGWGGLAARARLGYGAPWGGGLWRNLEA